MEQLFKKTIVLKTSINNKAVIILITTASVNAFNAV